jgi:hypothetical protein
VNDQNDILEERGGAQTEASIHHPAPGKEQNAACGAGGQPPFAPRTAGPSPLAELDQLVTAERLREIVWDEESRPSIQWIRKETKRRMLPHIRRGRLVFYVPRSVMEWYLQRESRPASMR